MTDGPLLGRVALVTGANHGIGAATAIELARLGADVAVAYLRFDTAAEPEHSRTYAHQRASDGGHVVAAIESLGRRAVAIECDLADPDVPRRLFDEADARLGPVAILVNNASGWRQDTFRAASTDGFGRPMGAVTAETFAAQFHVDARGGALLMAELAARHRASGATWGRVISLTSGGPMGFPDEVSYGAAKAALENYTMSASVELAADGITANVVYPPVTDTGWITDEVRAAIERSTDLVHVAQPAEVATVIGWLCTPAADLVTGNVVRLR